MLTGCSSSYLCTRLQPWPVLGGPTVLCCCPCSSQGMQSVGTITHTTTHAAARTDRKDDMAVCPGLEPSRTRWMDTHTHTQHMHSHTHTPSRLWGPSPSALGMGPAALGAFGRQLLHMGSVCLCVCASVFEGRRLGAGG